MNETKNAIEGINIRLYQVEERICEVDDRLFHIFWFRGDPQQKEWKRMKKAYLNHRIPLKDAIDTFLKSRKEKRGRKGTWSLFKKKNGAENLPDIGRELVI